MLSKTSARTSNGGARRRNEYARRFRLMAFLSPSGRFNQAGIGTLLEHPFEFLDSKGTICCNGRRFVPSEPYERHENIRAHPTISVILFSSAFCASTTAQSVNQVPSLLTSQWERFQHPQRGLSAATATLANSNLAPDEIISIRRLPSVAESKAAAGAQGLVVEKIVLTDAQITAVYRNTKTSPIRSLSVSPGDRGATQSTIPRPQQSLLYGTCTYTPPVSQACFFGGYPGGRLSHLPSQSTILAITHYHGLGAFPKFAGWLPSYCGCYGGTYRGATYHGGTYRGATYLGLTVRTYRGGSYGGGATVAGVTVVGATTAGVVVFWLLGTQRVTARRPNCRKPSHGSASSQK